MHERKYPTILFVIGFITNVLFHFFWLFIPSVILLVVGIFVKPCLYIGLALLLLDFMLSLIEQLKIRKAMLGEIDNLDVQKIQEALTKDKNWMKNIQEVVEPMEKGDR